METIECRICKCVIAEADKPDALFSEIDGFRHAACEDRRKGAIQAARDIYQNDDLEIDDDARLSVADNGVWVQAWIWVSNEETNTVDEPKIPQ